MLWLKINSIMKKQKISQAGLARRMGVGNSTISEFKRGNIKKPSFELMCKIADALDVSLDVFREEKEDGEMD